MESKIIKTTDYSLFETITGNRSLNQNKIQKICTDIDNGFNMLPYCPIIVSKKDDKLQIIDGQHRFQVSKSTGNPVYYVECNTLTLKQIAQLNSRGEKWKPQDFLQCYINLGFKDYEDILEVMNTYGIAIKTVVNLLMYFSVDESHKNSTEVFQNGDFKTNYLEETKEILALTSSLFSRYVFSKDRYLIGALIRIKEKGKCDFEELKQKIKAAPNMMDRQANIKNYIYNIEKVYNYKRQQRQVIY